MPTMERAVTRRFRDSLAAAALAGELSGSSRAHLAAAARAARDLLTAEPGGNLLTLVDGLYAALAAGDGDTAAALAALPPERHRSPRAPAPEPLAALAAALQAAARGDRDTTAELAGDGLRAAGRADPLAPQFAALAAWADGEPMDLDAVQATADAEDDLVARFGLPARGLTALP
jgi:hypothetical protein